MFNAPTRLEQELAVTLVLAGQPIAWDGLAHYTIRNLWQSERLERKLRQLFGVLVIQNYV